MTHFLSSRHRRAQARIIEALLAVFIMTVAILTATFYSTTTSQVSGENLQQTANNLIYALDNTEALQGILSAAGNWQAQLQQLIQSLLPAGTYFNANVLLSNGTILNTSPIGNMGGLQFGVTTNVTYVISISLPSPYAKLSMLPTKFNVVLVNDISGSMKWVEPNITETPPASCSYDGRWICPLYPGQNSKEQDARLAAKGFVNDLNVSTNGDHIGIVAFGDSGYIRSHLTGNKATVLNTISNLTAQAEGTYLSDGLAKAIQVYNHNPVRPENQSQWVMVLLTDGYPTYPGDGSSYSVRGANDALGNATILHNMNVTMFTIGLGVEIDPGLLTAIAGSPSNYFYAPTSADLQGIYQTIANRLSIGVGLTSETVILQITLATSG
jgi:hypothetical protein